ncbi:MAG: transposase, partial [Bacteroidetes bacterium]|nr:transposase [Bacteroidota bacterium]
MQKFDLKMNEELEAEGFSREFVRKVQSERKNQGLKRGDLIELKIHSNIKIKKMFEQGFSTFDMSFELVNLIVDGEWAALEWKGKGKHQKEFMKNLKEVYRAASKEMAEQNLDKLEVKWGKKYGIVIKSWRNNWDYLSRYFRFTAPIRKIIYTTNPIEG